MESFRQSATHAAPTAPQLGDRITGLLRLADEEATARRSSAKVDADQLTKEAEERTKQALSEAEEQARKILTERKKSRRSDIDARRRIDSLEQHHTDLVQRMTRMRDVLVDLLGQERAASDAAKPAPAPRRPDSRAHPRGSGRVGPDCCGAAVCTSVRQRPRRAGPARAGDRADEQSRRAALGRSGRATATSTADDSAINDSAVNHSGTDYSGTKRATSQLDPHPEEKAEPTVAEHTRSASVGAPADPAVRLPPTLRTCRGTSTR